MCHPDNHSSPVDVSYLKFPRSLITKCFIRSQTNRKTDTMVHKFECFQEGCNFLVRADTVDEVVYMVQEHARREHDISLDESTIEGEVQTA